MKVLYVSAISLASRTGDTEHVVSICREMANQGDEVHLVAVDHYHADGKTETETETDGALRVHRVPVGHCGAFRKLKEVSVWARKLVRELRPDIVYIRPFPLDWVFLLRHLNRDRVPYVCELNTMIASEYRSKGQALKGRIYEWFDAMSIRNALGIVTVTDEIGDWATRISGVRKPMLVAGNGVDLDRVPIPTAHARSNVRARHGLAPNTLVLAMAGFASPWHGFDRAIAMLPHLGSDTQLWLIGAEGDAITAQAQAIARSLGVESMLKVFPRLDSAALSELLAAADIGIGPLAIDRKSMTEAQPIKVRFYVAIGLPVLYNYRDPRLDPALPFFSLVKSTHPQALVAGIEKLRHLQGDMPEAARQFAAKTLSWRAIAAETRHFLSGILASAGR